MNCWTNLKELANLQNWMCSGDTIISKSEKVISGKQLSKPIKGYLSDMIDDNLVIIYMDDILIFAPDELILAENTKKVVMTSDD